MQHVGARRAPWGCEWEAESAQSTNTCLHHPVSPGPAFTPALGRGMARNGCWVPDMDHPCGLLPDNLENTPALGRRVVVGPTQPAVLKLPASQCPRVALRIKTLQDTKNKISDGMPVICAFLCSS